jgi:iron complex outermembrane receptor protein
VTANPSPHMPTQSDKFGRSFVFAFTAAGTLTCAALYGQTAPTARPATAEETIRLSPFSVESRKDYGYRAANSTSATGSGQPVIYTPLSISILTEDFLKDKNLTELRDALRFVTGISTDYQQVFSRGFTSVIKNDGAELSGSGTGDFMTYNADRIEVVKGPVSVLQGRASAGGVVNLISRRPKFYQQTNVEVGYGSFERKFGQVRTTGPIADPKLAYLVSYTKLDRDGWVDRNSAEDDVVQFGLEYRPIPRLTINANVEQATRKGYPEQHLTFTHPDFLAQHQEAVRLYDTNNLARPAAFPQIGESTATWLGRRGYPASTPTEVVNVNELMYPRGYRANIQGSQAYENRDRTTSFFEAKYRITDRLDWRSFYYSYRELFEYARQSTFRPVGGIGGLAIADRPQMGESRSKFANTMHELVARFATAGINHRALIGFEYRDTKTRALILNGSLTPNPYRTGGDIKVVNDVLAANPNGFNRATPFTATQEQAFYAIDQMDAFNERLHVFVGGRQSEAEQRGLKPRKFTPQYGVLGKVPGVEGVTVFGTYGESFRPNYIVDGRGTLVPPTLENNTEFGVKVDMLESKISGSASVYEIEQNNVALRDFAAEAATGIQPIYNVAGAARSAGAEFDLIYTPMRNYQVVFGYSRIWEARTLVAQDTRQQNIRINGAPDYTITFWNKYTFVQGRLKGAFVGFGARVVGEVHVHPSWSAPIYARNVRTADILLGYPVKFGSVEAEVSLRVDNLADKFFYDQSFRPATGRTFYLGSRMKF